MHISVQNINNRKIALAGEENKLPKNGIFRHKNGSGGHIVFQNEPNNNPKQALVTINIPTKFEKDSSKIAASRGVTVKSLHTVAAAAAYPSVNHSIHHTRWIQLLPKILVIIIMYEQFNDSEG